MSERHPDSAEEALIQSGDGAPDDATSSAPPPESDPEWSRLLEYLLTSRGFDFHGYKAASLARRIRKRMESVGVETFAGYQEYLEVHPSEFATLFNTILINVTSFFRDPAAWEVVRTRAVPEILAGKSPEEPIRAWSAGCASGEEAYTIAIILAEALGLEAFQQRVKIYATDVDDDALNSARHATYSARHVEGVPPELLGKYFDHADGIYTFRKDLRRQVIFGRHDLINDAPISRVDLLTCRNTLMYLSSETQTRVLSRLHFALNEGGFLLLGRSETLIAHGHSFVSVDLKRRLSRKGTRRTVSDQAFRKAERGAQQDGGSDGRLNHAALEASPVAQVVVDSAGELAMANERARELFGLL